MKTYKDFEKKYIGSSDIAALVLAGCKREEGAVLEWLRFSEDGDYDAYIVDETEIEIGEHYKEVARFNSWLKVYDDLGLSMRLDAREIIVYRAAKKGCIIQLIA